MKKFISQFPLLVPRLVTVTAVAAALAFTGSAVAAADPAATTSTSSTAVTQASLQKVASRAAAKKEAEDESTEARIKSLHDKLAITPAQEDLWKKVAAIMQENAEQITTLAKNRAEKVKTMTAVDDLNSYAEISGAHEDGTKKLIPAFKALYESMPAAQQKAADAIFREGGRHEHRGHGRPVS
ncbi:MAG: hypothetical protein NVS9B10_29180 [Nevskia sp.]